MMISPINLARSSNKADNLLSNAPRWRSRCSRMRWYSRFQSNEGDERGEWPRPRRNLGGFFGVMLESLFELSERCAGPCSGRMEREEKSRRRLSKTFRLREGVSGWVTLGD